MDLFKSILLLVLVVLCQNGFTQFEKAYPGGFQLVQRLGAEPQVILIGDSHGRPGQSGAAVDAHFGRGVPIVLELGQPGDLILVEAEDWRDPHYNLHDVLEQNHPLKKLDKSFRIGGWDNIDLAGYAKGYYELSLANYASPLLDNQVRANFYTKLFYTVGIRDRNRIMMQAIEKALSDGFERVFVFAGTNHVIDPELKNYLIQKKLSHLIVGRELSQIQVESRMMEQEIYTLYLEFGEHNLSRMLDLEKKFVAAHRKKIMEELGGELSIKFSLEGKNLSCKRILSAGL